ncbi:MAG: hypothetical protein V1753_08710 [Pseudomonadota bacterium]
MKKFLLYTAIICICSIVAPAYSLAYLNGYPAVPYYSYSTSTQTWPWGASVGIYSSTSGFALGYQDPITKQSLNIAYGIGQIPNIAPGLFVTPGQMTTTYETYTPFSMTKLAIEQNNFFTRLWQPVYGIALQSASYGLPPAVSIQPAIQTLPYPARRMLDDPLYQVCNMMASGTFIPYDPASVVSYAFAESIRYNYGF